MGSRYHTSGDSRCQPIPSRLAVSFKTFSRNDLRRGLTRCNLEVRASPNWKTCFSTLLLCSLSYAQTGPPSGYNVVVPAPSSALDPGQFGDYVDLVLDSNGDPALTYAFYDPSGTGNFSTSGLFFVRWDRAQGKWTTPVRIAQMGDNRVNSPGNVSSLSYDASTNTFAVAYTVGGVGRIDYAASTDGGQTWRSQTVVTDNQYTLTAPQLAIGGGRAYLAFIREADGLRFLTGSETTAPMTWASRLVPNSNGAARSPMSLKLDSAGVPGLAFWAFPTTGSSSVLGFWRPAYAQTIQVATTLGIQNDFIGVSLAFLGTNPRLALYADLDPASRRSPSYASYSNDGGLTWAPDKARSDWSTWAETTWEFAAIRWWGVPRIS